MPQGTPGHRTQTRSDDRRDQKKQARSASPERAASHRVNRQELEERASARRGEASVPERPKREPREAAQARTSDQARGEPGAAQGRHAAAERKLGQRPEQENEEEDEE
jgi:hypothetical protein